MTLHTMLAVAKLPLIVAGVLIILVVIFLLVHAAFAPHRGTRMRPRALLHVRLIAAIRREVPPALEPPILRPGPIVRPGFAQFEGEVTQAQLDAARDKLKRALAAAPGLIPSAPTVAVQAAVADHVTETPPWAGEKPMPDWLRRGCTHELCEVYDLCILDNPPRPPVRVHDTGSFRAVAGFLPPGGDAR